MEDELKGMLFGDADIDEDRWNDFEVVTSITDIYGSGYFQVYAELREIPDEERDTK